MQSGIQIRLSSSVEISGTSDLSTIVYIDDDVLSFFGIPLPLEMIQEWFGNETTFIDVLNQGPDEIYDWAVSNIPEFAEDNSGLAIIAPCLGNGQSSVSTALLLEGQVKAFAAVWENSVSSPPVPTAATVGRQEPSIAAPIAFTASAASVPTTTSYAPSFSTYIDGAGGEILRDIAFDSFGNVYVTGGTQSFQNMPITAGNDYYNGTGVDGSGSFVPPDVFVQKYNPSGNLLWSSRLGGKSYDRAYGIEVDDNGSVYVAGCAGADFYVTQGVLQESFGHNTPASTNSPYGKQDGFVAKFDSDTGQLDWSTYFGGKAGEIVRDIDMSDGTVVETIHVSADRWHNETQTFTIDAGMVLDGTQEIEIEYINDLQSGSGNLFIQGVTVNGKDVSLAEAEITSTVGSYNTSKDIIYLGTDGSAVFSAANPSLSQGTTITLLATANLYQGPAEANLLVNGQIVDTFAVSANKQQGQTDTFDFHSNLSIGGIDTLQIEFTNDLNISDGGDRNLFVDEVQIDGIDLYIALVDIDASTGTYNPNTGLIALTSDGTATFDLALQADLFGL